MRKLALPVLPILRTGNILGVLLAMVIAAGVVQTTSLLYLSREATENNAFLTAHPFTRYDHLRELRMYLGYGGMVYNFKNAILRGGDTSAYAERAIESARKAIDVINQYRTLNLSADEVQALADIETVVHLYEQKIPQLQEMHAQGHNLSEIDAAMRIDDTPSLQGVKTLDAAIRREMGASLTHLEEDSSKIRMVSYLAAATSFASLLVLLGFMVWYRRMQFANMLRDMLAMAKNLASGSTEFLEADARRGDEVGTIARAIINYREIAASQKEMTNAVFNAVHDALITIDRKGFITSVNPATVSIFGYTQQEMVAQNIKMLMPLATAMSHDSYLAHYKIMGKGHSTVIGRARELMAQHKDGKIFPIELSVAEMAINGETYFAGVVRDISERKKQEDQIVMQAHELAKRAEELEHSNADLEDFAYIASHDLREPLRGLYNYASFLKEDYADKLDEKGNQQLDSLMKLSQRLDQLVSSLLYYSRVGRQELAQQPTDLQDAVSHVVEDLKPYLDENHARVAIASPLPVLTCDHVRISEVFRNLITNAIKYNDHDTKQVEIGVRTDTAPWPVLFVRDNGIGIDPQYRETVFKMFKRLHKREEYQGGTGAGLTITKKIIERHGGKIWIEGNPDGGSSFCFTLPEVAAAPANATIVPLATPTPAEQQPEEKRRDAA
jgi:PAS domain S-box-containing protein